MQTRYYDPEVGRFISQDSIEYADPESINGLNLYAYCGNNPVMGYDPTGTWDWGKFWAITGIVVGTALFVISIIASAGTVGALVGVGAAALGLSATAASAISTAATIGTYIVATGVAIFGLSDALEIANDGYNPIRDDFMGGNQTAYNITRGIFDVLGTVAVLAGTFGPKILQKVAQSGIPSREGFSRSFEINGNWSARVDATIHGNPKWHHNPHVHFLQRDLAQGGRVINVYYFWEVIRMFIGRYNWF